ncbi:hypothetical protein [Streptomyces sp. NPDC097610]|uniref:hypothetical protein n=1 Tax=Streptomyces sp. NPDC097610 TaxID=3157227 RepID=UPI00331861B6
MWSEERRRSGKTTLAVQGAVLQGVVAMHLEPRVARDVDKTESPERFQRAVKAYKRLVTLLKARDAEGAERHWRTRMKVAGTYFVRGGLRGKPGLDPFA